MDLGQHRLHAQAAAVAGFRHRLEPRARHLQPRLLPLEPVAVPASAGKRHRLQEDPGRELGPGGPDRACQRTGHRRQGLAHRRHGREARDSRLLPRDHQIRGRTAGGARHAARLAGAGESDAGELDRQESGRALRISVHAGGQGRKAVGVHHPRRHHHGRHLRRRRRRASAGDSGGAKQSRTRRLHRRMQTRFGDGGRPRDHGKERHADGHFRRAPAERRENRGLGRQLRADGLRRRRGDGGAGPRRTRFRFREEVRPADPSQPAPGRTGTPTRNTASARTRENTTA